jgi:UDP-N-acetylmuramoyl-tripeptide--D-alanyl-D-alanine ligase
MIAQLLAGLWFVYQGVHMSSLASLYFGLALIVSYPVVWAHLLPIVALPGVIFWLKPLGKRVLCRLLERQVVRLRKRHDFAVVAVVGSVGKTSTKLAIADALSVSRRVRYQLGNYNDRLTVPLIFFGHPEPAIYNVFAWAKILLANRRAVRQDYPYDVVVVELGIDAPAQMKYFAYLQPDLTVVTAVAPEHMENFSGLDEVAREELAVFDFSHKMLVNTDDVPADYLNGRQYVSYGSKAMYSLKSTRSNKSLSGQRVTFDLAGRKVSASIQLIGRTGAKIALAAAAACGELALSEDDIKSALTHLRPMAGRMQTLPGIRKSILLDDTYNASPAAVAAALEVLQTADTPQRIAILGSMNELGSTSPATHRSVGELCDPKRLDLVVTVGVDARDYLAPAAKERGCTVVTFLNPHGAGEYVQERLKDKAVVLAKGSQNGVFAEEALKPLLKNKADEAKLVRQSAYWLKIKQRQFGD